MAKRPLAICDTECLSNFWSIGFRDYEDPSKRWAFYFMPGMRLDIESIAQLLSYYTIVTFNGKRYDNPMITLAMHGADNATLKQANDLTIRGGLTPWAFMAYYRIEELPYLDDIDISEVAPGVKISLKVYSGRTHSKQMKDFPRDHNEPLPVAEIASFLAYQDDDLDNTADLLRTIWNRIELRYDMTEQYAQYGVDLRSKSDAQIAETLYKAILDYKGKAPVWPHHTQFYYQPLEYLQFQTPQLQQAYRTILTSPFLTSDKDQVTDEVDENGNKVKSGIIIPKAIKDIRLIIGGTAYKFGYGGLHSQEHCICHHAVPGELELSDHDVTSYYPMMMINQRLFPSQLGEAFLGVFTSFVDNRVDAKGRHKAYSKQRDAGVPGYDWDHWIKHFVTIDEGGKIIINGTFGKLGSKYSVIFAPDKMVQVTISGQLNLLLLIEMLEMAGISVVSANTDGIVLKTPLNLVWLRDSIIADWMQKTNLNMEKTEYSALYSRDVNNYIAIKTDGEAKGKGLFAKATVGKSPKNQVCVEAVIKYVTDGIPLDVSILQCRDIRKFLTVQSVTGGAIKNGEKLGKAVRWYYGAGEMGTINYITTGNKVPRSEGAVPLMRLPDEFPPDIDYTWYFREAAGMLTEIGVK